MLRPILAVLSLVLLSCGHKSTGTGTPPETFCPGAPGCDSGSNGTFKAGIASVVISPTGWEKPVPLYLGGKGDDCPDQAPIASDGLKHCGSLIDSYSNDCGTDTLCSGDNGYTAPDADGTEGDGKPDWFYDCGRDQKCPGDMGYTGPDADGSEGDGKFQGFWFAGFSNNTPMWDIHDDIQARAVVFINGDVEVAMVAVDSIGLFYDDVVRMRNAVTKKMGTNAPDYVLVSATHTHESADTMGQFGPETGVLPARGVDDDWFTNRLIEGVAQAVVTAASQAQPAKLFATQVKLGMETRQVLMDDRDPFVSDDTITVLKLTQTDGTAIGTVMSWGSHPETLSDVNNSMSADYVGYLRTAMEKGVFMADGSMVAAGAGGTSIFFAGALGGMMSGLHAPTQTLEGVTATPHSIQKIQAIANRVAKTALDGLANAMEIPKPPLAFGAQTIKLPIENALFQLIGQFDIIRRRSYDYDKTKPITPTNMPKIMSEVAKIELGPLKFVAVPGELFPELAIGYDQAFAFGYPQIKPDNPNKPDLTKAPGPPYLKSLAGGEMPCILGLANDEIGYIIPPYDFQVDADQPYVVQAPGDHYEETNSLGPNTVPLLTDAFLALFKWEPSN